MTKLLLAIGMQLIGLLCFAQTAPQSSVELSLSTGTIFPGNVEASYESHFPSDETVDIENKISPILKMVADYYVISNLSMGVNLNFAKFNIDDILFDGESMKEGNEVNLGTWDDEEHIIILDDIKMLEANLSLKWRFKLNDKMALKPCLYGGYRRTFSSSPTAREQGVVLNYNAEFQYYLSSTQFILTDFGFLSQPYGGVSKVGYVRTSGVAYFTLGYGLTL